MGDGLDDAFDDEPDDPALGVEPTTDERKNGWTKSSLTRYLNQRAHQQEEFATELANSKIRQAKSQSTKDFNPHSWGK